MSVLLYNIGMPTQGKHKRITEEMMKDLSLMGDKEFAKKWDTSRQYPIRVRKRLGIKSFNNQHDLREHKFIDGKEYKWCGSGHWELIENFYVHSSRWDGLRSVCIPHEKEYPSNNIGRKPWNTRRHNSIRKGAFVSWTEEDELKVYKLCNHACAYCQSPLMLEDVEFDHFIPVKSGGKTEPSNMLPSCSSCNRGRCGKFKKDPYEWLIERFGFHFGEMIYKNCVSILEKL